MTEKYAAAVESLAKLVSRVKVWYWRGRPVKQTIRLASWRRLFREPFAYLLTLGSISYLVYAYLSAVYAPVSVGCVMATLCLSGVYMSVRMFWELIPPLHPESLRPRHLAAMDRLGYSIMLDERLRVVGFNMIRGGARSEIRFDLDYFCWVGERFCWVGEGAEDTSWVPGLFAHSSSRTPMEEARRLELLDRRAKFLYNDLLSKGGLRAE